MPRRRPTSVPFIFKTSTAQWDTRLRAATRSGSFPGNIRKVQSGGIGDGTMSEFAGELLKGAEELQKKRGNKLRKTEKESNRKRTARRAAPYPWAVHILLRFQHTEHIISERTRFVYLLGVNESSGGGYELQMDSNPRSILHGRRHTDLQRRFTADGGWSPATI